MTVQNDFWSWFLQHESELFNFDPMEEVEREKLFDSLASQLAKVNSELSFEFSPRNTKREFVISASGIESAFPAVVSLIAAAPALDRWELVAFRPRRLPHIVELAGKRVHPEDVFVTLLDNGKMAGVSLFIPGFSDDDIVFKQIGYLLLNETLSEYDVVTRLGFVEMLSPDAHTTGERIPPASLAFQFDKLVSRLSGDSGKPS